MYSFNNYNIDRINLGGFPEILPSLIYKYVNPSLKVGDCMENKLLFEGALIEAHGNKTRNAFSILNY